MRRGLPLLVFAIVGCLLLSSAPAFAADAARKKHPKKCKTVKKKLKSGRVVKRRVCKKRRPKKVAPKPSRPGQATPATDAPSGSTPTGPGNSPPDPPPASKHVVGYFTSWGIYGRNYQPTDIPASKLTDINYAFANVSNGGECTLGDPWADTDKPYPGDDPGGPHGNFNQLNKLKQAHPQLHTHISVGGWTWSSKFSDVALTPSSRAAFATSCADFMQQYGFDGIDIDWEYPVGGGMGPSRPEDKHNYTLLLDELRSELDARGQAAGGRHYSLTIAAPAGVTTAANFELEDIHTDLDWVNVMTYDMSGPWSSVTGFNAPLYESADDPEVTNGFNVDNAVSNYLNRQVPPAKLVVGVPFYGRSFAGAGPTNNGLYQSFTGTGPGSYDPGMLDYRDIVSTYLPPAAGYTRYSSATAKVPWLYKPSASSFISYDNPQSIGLKANYARDRGLGGVMIWELSGDTDNDALLDSINAGL